MKIAICASIDITPKIKKVADELQVMGHEVIIPFTSQKILNGNLSMKKFLQEKKEKGDGIFRKIRYDAIKGYYKKIKKMDAVLILNLDKNGIKNYIGGNTFLEMGFAYVLEKTIYLYNEIPKMSYTDELVAMQPIVIKKNLKKIICNEK